MLMPAGHAVRVDRAVVFQHAGPPFVPSDPSSSGSDSHGPPTPPYPFAEPYAAVPAKGDRPPPPIQPSTLPDHSLMGPTADRGLFPNDHRSNITYAQLCLRARKSPFAPLRSQAAHQKAIVDMLAGAIDRQPVHEPGHRAVADPETCQLMLHAIRCTRATGWQGLAATRYVTTMYANLPTARAVGPEAKASIARAILILSNKSLYYDCYPNRFYAEAAKPILPERGDADARLKYLNYCESEMLGHIRYDVSCGFDSPAANGGSGQSGLVAVLAVRIAAELGYPPTSYRSHARQAA